MRCHRAAILRRLMPLLLPLLMLILRHYVAVSFIRWRRRYFMPERAATPHAPPVAYCMCQADTLRRLIAPPIHDDVVMPPL